MPSFLQNKLQLSTLLLVIFYSVGLIGMLINPTTFSSLTPFNLLLTGFLLFGVQPEKNTFFYITLLLIFMSAFMLECMGVNSGLIFGNYIYGKALGWQLANTPIIIGLNWIIVAYSSLQFVNLIAVKLKLKLHELVGAGFGAILMVALDLLIEPIAPKLDFWTWEHGIIPFKNYTAWFFFGYAFCYWMLKSNFLLENKMGWRIYLAQFVFFLILNFLG